jgi:hypothetical protein
MQTESSALQLARALIQRYGMRAQAVASERASELRLKGDTEEYDRWQQVQTLISELRQGDKGERHDAH